jgi:DNA-binding NarL/FixJ family response regulator
MTRVFVVDDHPGMREAICAELSREVDIQVVGSAATAAEARQLLLKTPTDVAIVDLVLPDTTGSALIASLRSELPKTDFLVLSAYEDYDRIYSAIFAGAVGYLGKTYVNGALAEAIREVRAGGSPMSSQIARKVLQAFHNIVKPQMPIGKLSDREQQILHILVTGRSYKEIATTLFISVETVRTHVRNIYRKLQVHSAEELKNRDVYRVV